MATRSTISVLTKQGTVKTIYCHFDGYLSNNGNLLTKDYSNYDKLIELIQLGSISSLKKHISTTGIHNFHNPVENVVVAYHRDRGEDLVINEFESIDDYVQALINNQITQEFNYIFKDGEWLVVSDDHLDSGNVKSINDFPNLEFALLTLPIKK